MLLESFTSLERLPWTVKLSCIPDFNCLIPVCKFNDVGGDGPLVETGCKQPLAVSAKLPYCYANDCFPAELLYTSSVSLRLTASPQGEAYVV